MAGNFTEVNSVTKRRFLNAFSESGQVRKAAAMAGISWVNHYKWLREDPDYPAYFQEAALMAGDVMEGEAVRRAVDGVDKPVYQRGEMVGLVREYSDPLLIFLLKGNKPEKFKDRTEHSGEVNRTLRIVIDD